MESATLTLAFSCNSSSCVGRVVVVVRTQKSGEDGGTHHHHVCGLQWLT